MPFFCKKIKIFLPNFRRFHSKKYTIFAEYVNINPEACFKQADFLYEFTE